jgi:hypothetical protein
MVEEGSTTSKDGELDRGNNETSNQRGEDRE